MKNIALSIVIALGGTAVGLPVIAQQSTVDTSANQTLATSQTEVSDAQLDSLLAPIALYPDTLLTHILIASTYPLDVISADRWRQSNKHLTPEQVEDVLEDVDWDPSVKALAAFTDLLNTMANDLDWLQQLGDSVLVSQDRVLDRVQVLRQHARNTGNLDTNDYVEVETEQNNSREIIYIAPRQREVVYVPYYDPQIVYGNWWHPIAPIFWSHHVNYHRHRNVYWSPRVRISAFFSFGAVHWNNRHVVVHRQPVRRFYRGSQRKRVISNDYQRWEHRVDHRRARYSQRVVQTKPTRFVHSSNRHVSTSRLTASPGSRSITKARSVSNAQLKAPNQGRALSSNRSVRTNKTNKRLAEKKQYNKQAILNKLDANKRHFAKTSAKTSTKSRLSKPQPIKPGSAIHKIETKKAVKDKARTHRTEAYRGKASQNRTSQIVRKDTIFNKGGSNKGGFNKRAMDKRVSNKQTVTRTSKQTVSRNVSPKRSVSRNEGRSNIRTGSAQSRNTQSRNTQSRKGLSQRTQSQNRLSRDK